MFLFWKVLLLFSSFQTGYCCMNYGQCIYRDIMSNYSWEVRPMENATHVVIVKVMLEVLGLKSINEVTETMDTTGFFAVNWTDHRLSWDPVLYGGVKDITVPARTVWLPDLVTYNSDTSFYKETYRRDFMVNVNHHGDMFWGYGGVISTSCQMNMEDYPFDTQSCDIIVESWSYNINNVDLKANGVFINESAHSTQVWNFVDANVTDSLKYHKQFRRLTFTLTWKRRRLYYYTNIILPITLLLMVTLGVFWIPVQSGEKISLAIALMLAFTVFQIVIMDNTPVTSNAIPKITQYVILVISMSMMSLLTSLFVVYINNRDCVARPSCTLKRIFFCYLAKILGMSKFKQIEKKPYDIKVEDNYMKYDDVSKFVHRLEDCKHKNINKHLESLDKISENVNYLVTHIEESNEKEEIKREWAYLGKVIDRLLFMVTLILSFILGIYIFTT